MNVVCVEPTNDIVMFRGQTQYAGDRSSDGSNDVPAGGSAWSSVTYEVVYNLSVLSTAALLALRRL